MDTPQSSELSPSLLEPLVALVATLGELAATVAGPFGDVLLAVSPGSLHKALVAFIGHLQDILGHHRSSRLHQVLVALGATPGPTWAHVTDEATAWRHSVATLGDGLARLLTEATELAEACRAVATAEATAEATAGALPDSDGRWHRARGDLVATARRLPVALGEALGKALEQGPDKGPDKATLTSALATYETEVATASSEVAAATEAMEEAVLAASQAEAAAARRRRAEAALGPLAQLVAACAEATALPRELLGRLGAIEAALEGPRGTKEASPGVPPAVVAAVAEGERLWEASGHLASGHLLATLGDIRGLLCSRHGGHGGHAVATRCQKALGDIPRLLRESDVS